MSIVLLKLGEAGDGGRYKNVVRKHRDSLSRLLLLLLLFAPPHNALTGL